MTLLELFQKAPREMRERVQAFATEQERAEGEDLAVMMDQYAAALEDATTPREPEPEWFGTGPRQHPAWWIKAGRYRTVLYGCRVRWNGSVPVALRSDNATDIPWEELEAVVPVELEGYPAPVGWQVLERNNS